MRDPGYIPEHGWNQEYPYGFGDDSGFDTLVGDILDDEELLAERNILEPRSVWLHRTIADRRRREREDLEAAYAARPTGNFAPGEVPDVADCDVTNPLDPAGAPSLAGSPSHA